MPKMLDLKVDFKVIVHKYIGTTIENIRKAA